MRGVGLALGTTALLIGPFVSEVRTAVAEPGAGSPMAERLGERMSKSDLSAGLAAKTASRVVRAPSETRRR